MKKKDISSTSGGVSHGDHASGNVTITGGVGGDVVGGDQKIEQHEIHHHYHQPPSSPHVEKREPQNPDDDPAVRAAKVTRSGTVRAAIIAALGVVLVAIISFTIKLWDHAPKLGEDKDKFIVKVLDKATSHGISGAKVSLEASDFSAVNTTDSEGVISFPLADPHKELRLRVEVTGYEPGFNLRVTPADIVGAQEVRLSPITLPTPTPRTRLSPGFTTAKPGSDRLVIRGQVIDESGAAVSGAQVIVAGHGATVTDSSGNFQIPVAVALGRPINLNVAKEGFRMKTLNGQASEGAIRILLERLQ